LNITTSKITKRILLISAKRFSIKVISLIFLTALKELFNIAFTESKIIVGKRRRNSSPYATSFNNVVSINSALR
jgi:hypothetical protein